MIFKKPAGMWGRKETKDTLLVEVGKRINRDLYNIKEDEEKVILELKHDILAEHAAEFIREHCSLYGENPKESLMEILEGRDYSKIMEMAKSKEEYMFQIYEFYPRITYLSKYHEVGAKACLFLMEGKAYLEGYNHLFSYLTSLMQKAIGNPLKGTLVVYMD